MIGESFFVEDINKGEKIEWPILTVDITVLNIKLPQLIRPSYFIISSQFFYLLNFFFPAEEKIVIFTEAVNLFVIHCHLLLKLQIFVKGLASDTILEVNIASIIF